MLTVTRRCFALVVHVGCITEHVAEISYGPLGSRELGNEHKRIAFAEVSERVGPQCML